MIRLGIQNILLAASLIALLSSCTPSNSVKTKPEENDHYVCEIDSNLIHNWNVYGELSELEFPFQKVYEGCGKRLIYIAARHVNSPESKTFKLIENSFRNNSIDFVIAEGFPSDMGLNPKDIVDHANAVNETPSDAEAFLAIRLAMQANAKFQGGEPSDKQIMDIVSNGSITPTDLLGFYIVRQIPQLIRQEKIDDHNDPHLNEVIFNMVGSFSEQTGISIAELAAVDGVADFSEWYKTTNGVSFKDGYREEDSWASVTDPEFFRTTNRIANAVGNARDQHIIGIIDNAIRKHDTVLIVYGGSHHTIQDPALIAAFNK